jgi:hypothetical protein
MVRRTCAESRCSDDDDEKDVGRIWVCADDDLWCALMMMITTRRMLLRTRGQNRRGKGELILHRFLGESRCLRLKLDKIRCLLLN